MPHPLLLPVPESLETPRLHLRRYRAGDGAWYHAMSQGNRAHLQRYESGNLAMTIHTEEEAEVVVRQMASQWSARTALYFAAFARPGRVFVAQIYLGPVSWEVPELCLGYFAEREHEGQGYVTEAARAVLRLAFEDLGAHRVRLYCDDTNTRSQRVAERCGMVREGHLREDHHHADGTRTGTLLYGLLRAEFAAP